MRDETNRLKNAILFIYLSFYLYLMSNVCSNFRKTQFFSDMSVTVVGHEVRPRVMKWSILDCDSTFEKYCLNNGQCMLLVDIKEHHCK